MKLIRTSLAAFVVLFAAMYASAGPILLANATLTSTSAGYYTDLSGLQGTMENGVAKTLLGGLGSGMAWGYVHRDGPDGTDRQFKEEEGRADGKPTNAPQDCVHLAL